jgi:hypothetical protein
VRRATRGAALLAAAVLALLVPAVPVLADSHGVDRPLRDPRIGESSGLAFSPQHDGVLWTHGDSGNPPVLYALGRDGRVAGTLRLQGGSDVDWEAMAAFRDRTGRALLAVGDIGDNDARRSRIEVAVVAEPARLGRSTDAPLLRLRLTYPDGARDAEALVVDAARGRMFVVTKGFFGGDVYMVPTAGWNGTAPPAGARPATRSARLVQVGRVPVGLVTDGAAAPGGAVLLRSYGELAAFAPFPLVEGDETLRPVATDGTPRQRQGEGLALPADGRSALLSSEGVGEPVLRVALPGPVSAALSASAAPSPSPTTRPNPSRTPSAGRSPAPSPAPSTVGGGGLGWGAVAFAAAAAVFAGLVWGRVRR